MALDDAASKRYITSRADGTLLLVDIGNWYCASTAATFCRTRTTTAAMSNDLAACWSRFSRDHPSFHFGKFHFAKFHFSEWTDHRILAGEHSRADREGVGAVALRSAAGVPPVPGEPA